MTFSKHNTQGFSILELTTTLAISIILCLMSMPHMDGFKKDAAFRNFASELAGHLTAARRTAQLTERSAAIDFEEQTYCLYATWLWEADQWRLFSMKAREQDKIRMELPPEPLKHPTTQRPINRALSLTHGSRLIFGPRGSGSGTVVFTDQDERSLCLVVSGQSGRIRIYLKMQREGSWRLYY